LRVRKLSGPAARLKLRPLLACRDYHALHRENSSFDFAPEQLAGGLVFRPYAGLPRVTARCNGRYAHAPLFYRDFLYRAERERGLDHVEDLGAPGELCFDLETGPAWVAFGWLEEDEDPQRLLGALDGEVQRQAELERRRALTDAELAREAYLIERSGRRTIIAGYPWFTDWGRDTFIALRGLCIASGALDAASGILDAWAEVVRGGLLPNYFPDGEREPEYNSIDAGLFYVVAVYEFLMESERAGARVAPELHARLVAAVAAVLSGLTRGTRYGIRVDGDGLLLAGEPGVQLTWMDAKVGDLVVTPRSGKSVEIQALWLNALRIGADLGVSGAKQWARSYDKGLSSFRSRFWNAAGSFLYDVVDVDLEPGQLDESVRPNQIFAVGGLPFELLPAAQAQAVVDRVQSELYTPLGLRTLSPRDPRYRGRYGGGVLERDTAYHMGTAWPWLLGPFVEAWLRSNGSSAARRKEALERFVLPWQAERQRAGLGHVSEIVDGDFPHAARGAPFQAWSLGELLRVERLLGERGPPL
jgi:predicted glycogen debranching enzyme